MSDEYEVEDVVDFDAVAGEMVEDTGDINGESSELTKLLQQHPEIWIPYREQVLEQAAVRPPTNPTQSEITLMTGLRDLSELDLNHSTYPFLTGYERTKCISYRASQICNGANSYLTIPPGVTDAYEIAKMELESKVLPFIVKRPLPDGSFEVWRLADLMLL